VKDSNGGENLAITSKPEIVSGRKRELEVVICV
jgi:hypothetical protein